jgi:hypothetical protein
MMERMGNRKRLASLPLSCTFKKKDATIDAH